MIELECGCIEFMDFEECCHCHGSGDDTDLCGLGFCSFCSGKGEREVVLIDYHKCTKGCESEYDEYENNA